MTKRADYRLYVLSICPHLKVLDFKKVKQQVWISWPAFHGQCVTAFHGNTSTAEEETPLWVHEESNTLCDGEPPIRSGRRHGSVLGTEVGLMRQLLSQMKKCKWQRQRLVFLLLV